MTNTQNQQSIVLASASEIRAKVLQNAGIIFSINATNIDEESIKKACLKKEQPIQYLVKKLALAKASAVKLTKNEVIIGADQVLEFEGKVFDKPKSIKEARSRLIELRGKEHKLIGAVCLVQKGKNPWYHINSTRLRMRNFSDGFLNNYIEEEGKVLTKCVGAYRFEGKGALLFDEVEGDFFSILGLPLLPLLTELRNRDVLAK